MLKPIFTHANNVVCLKNGLNQLYQPSKEILNILLWFKGFRLNFEFDLTLDINYRNIFVSLLFTFYASNEFGMDHSLTNIGANLNSCYQLSFFISLINCFLLTCNRKLIVLLPSSVNLNFPLLGVSNGILFD